MSDGDIRSATLDELREIWRQRGPAKPPPPDSPVLELDDAFWKNAKLVMPGDLEKVLTKASVHLRVDRDVLDWFRSQGKGHLTRMNAVLRAYYEAHRDKKRPKRAKPKAA